MNDYVKTSFGLIPPSLVPPKVWNIGVNPHSTLKPDCLDPELKCYTGPSLDILSSVAKLLNAQLNITLETNTTGCGENVNGSWSGLMRRLKNGEIDGIGNVCSLNNDRINQNFSKFTYPLFHDKQTFLIKAPPLEYKFEFEAPFQTSLWLIVILYVVIFLNIRVFYLMLCRGISVKDSIQMAFTDMWVEATGLCNSTYGQPFFWSCWSVFVGYFLLLYSTSITVVLLKPAPIRSPFANNFDLAVDINKGNFRFIDYKVPNPLCSEEACRLFQRGIAKYGYQSTKRDSMLDINYFLSNITHSDNLVYTSGKIWISDFFQHFEDRFNLWLIEDELMEEIRYSFFFRHDFPGLQLINSAILLIGDYKMRSHQRNENFLSMVHQGKSIKARIPKKFTINFDVVMGPLTVFSIGLILSCIIFTFEFSHTSAFQQMYSSLQMSIQHIVLFFKIIFNLKR